MRTTLIVLALLSTAALVAPQAAASPCTWREVYVSGVDVDACLSDESGRPTVLIVKHKDVGGVMVGDTESEIWGSNWRFTDVIVFTYWRTPVVGQSATYVGFWCLDYGMDGNCDWFAVGATTYAKGVGAGVYLRNTAYDGWALCTGSVVNCMGLPLLPEDDVPYLPYLP